MKDATDEVTGELVLPRGRGRPRKPGAMTNAERQAAYRARHRGEPVTVTEKQLVEARERIEALGIIADDLRRKLCKAEMERDAVIGWGVSRDEGKLQAALKASSKSVTRKRVTKKGA